MIAWSSVLLSNTLLPCCLLHDHRDYESLARPSVFNWV